MTIATAVAAAQVAPQAAPPAAGPTAPQAAAQAAGAGQATPQDALAVAQQSAEKTAKAWMTLGQGLDEQLAPLLPCDPKARKTVQDVSKASDARVTASANYLHLAAAQASEQTAGTRRLLETEEGRTPETGDERTDAALERSTVEAQSANLTASWNIRPGLSDARNTLGQITEVVAKRSSLVDQHSTARDKGVAALRDLAAAYQAREAAFKEEIAAFQAEAARWNTYYTVRLARVQAECSAIGGGPSSTPTPARNTKKGATTKKGTTKGSTKPPGSTQP